MKPGMVRDSGFDEMTRADTVFDRRLQLSLFVYVAFLDS